MKLSGTFLYIMQYAFLHSRNVLFISVKGLMSEKSYIAEAI